MRYLGLFVIMILFLTGCVRTHDFTMISTKNVILGSDTMKSKGTYEGEDTRSIIIFVPLGEPSIKEAADRAMERGGGNLMLNVVLYRSYWYVPLIYGEVTYTIKGDVYSVDVAHKNSLAKNAGSNDGEQK